MVHDPKGFEEQDNHQSDAGCNKHLVDWFSNHFHNSTRVSVLDVGGGRGGLQDFVSRDLPETVRAALDWDCIDVTPSKRCKAFDGKSFGAAYEENSYDVVIFNYVLHHVADNTIDELKDAARVAKQY